MYGKILWGVLLFSLLGQPAWSAEVTMEEEAAQTEAAGILPPAIYSEGPFEQSTTTVRLGEILGGKTGYIHPFLSVGELYKDNLFNSESDRESDFITMITPGIWFVLPASRYPLIRLSTLNTSPGGLELSRFRSKAASRIQAYAKYQANILLHDEFDSEDHVNQRAEGFFQYNFRGGLSIDVMDIYELDHDAYGTGISTSLDKFKSNLVSSTVSYEFSPKTRIEGEYGFYTLDYSADRNAFRDREDNSFAGRFFYRFLPKTSALLEYNFIDIDYDEDVISDSEEHQVYAGVEWIATVKSRLRAKVGYGLKDFDATGSDEVENLLAEIQFHHRFTPKSYLELKATRKTNETDIAGTAYSLSHRVQLRYFQTIMPKLMTSANIYYARTGYRGGGTSGDRRDNHYGAGLDLKYTLTRWLVVSGGYDYLKRDSSFSDSDYDRNNVYLNLIFAL
jgi:hypothetical protein